MEFLFPIDVGVEWYCCTGHASKPGGRRSDLVKDGGVGEIGQPFEIVSVGYLGRVVPYYLDEVPRCVRREHPLRHAVRCAPIGKMVGAIVKSSIVF
jgi:hypothetical protein